MSRCFVVEGQGVCSSARWAPLRCPLAAEHRELLSVEMLGNFPLEKNSTPLHRVPTVKRVERPKCNGRRDYLLVHKQ